MNIFSCAASILKMLEGPSSSIYQASSFKNLPSHLKVELLLSDDSKLSANDNDLILKASIKYIMTTNRFSVPLFWYCFLSLALNIYIYSLFFLWRPAPPDSFFHCSIWQSSEMCACDVFSCLFFDYLFVRYFSFIFCLIQL